jgi:hypothetical protein
LFLVLFSFCFSSFLQLLNPSQASAEPGFSTFSLRELKSAERHLSSLMSGLALDDRPSLIDTHCHVDFLVNKLKGNRKKKNGDLPDRGGGMAGRQGFGGLTGDAYEQFLNDRADEYSALFGASIACFCSPTTFKNVSGCRARSFVLRPTSTSISKTLDVAWFLVQGSYSSTALNLR